MSKPRHRYPALPSARALSTVATALACLAVPVAHAEESSPVEVPRTQNLYIPDVARLYEQGKYEQARSRLEKALDWKSNGTRELVWLKIMQGVLRVGLDGGEGEAEAQASFTEALELDREAQLPVQSPSRRLRRIFEQARNALPPLPEKELVEPQSEPSLVAQVEPEVTGPPPRRYGMSVGVRGEVDVLGLGVTTAVTPGVSLGYTREKLGGVLTVLVQPSPGLRAEGQFHPLTLGRVRPYARVGATAFFREVGTEEETVFLGGVGGRGVLGVDVQLTSRMSAFADVAYERFFNGGAHYRSESVLFSVGVGLFP